MNEVITKLESGNGIKSFQKPMTVATDEQVEQMQFACERLLTQVSHDIHLKQTLAMQTTESSMVKSIRAEVLLDTLLDFDDPDVTEEEESSLQ